MTILFALLAAIGWSLYLAERDRRLMAERIAKLSPDKPTITIRSPESVESRSVTAAKQEARDKLDDDITAHVKRTHPEKSVGEQERIAKELRDQLMGGI